MLRRAIFIVLLSAATFPAGATDYTATWWNPTESGQGYTFTQNGNFIFATFFVYGPATAPTWYTGQLTLDATGTFIGPLYATTGPWFGTVPFDPGQVTRNQVGNATFQPTAADTGVLTYNVAANTQVVKNIQRQTLVPIALVGNYVGGVALNITSCPSPADNTVADAPLHIQVTQGQTGQIQVAFIFASTSICTFASSGPVTQAGQLFAFPAAYTCSDGPNTTATVSELRATSLGIEGRWTTSNGAGGCHEDARFGGVLQF
jgi:hypothetical protein